MLSTIKNYVFDNTTNNYINNIPISSQSSDMYNSYSKGVLTEERYGYGKTRTTVSMKICFITWLYELLGTIATALSPTIQSLGMPNTYFPDAIIMFLVIPFCHLINDETTKGIIAENGWYQGMKHMVGSRNQIVPRNAARN